jgi:ParB-like chromosome segregation protein Spo0J
MEGNIIKHRTLEVKVVPLDMVYANDYNPNRMPSKEMDLLKDCILKYGFLFPVITSFNEDKKRYKIIDGEHRYEVLKRIGSPDISIIDLKLPYHDAVQLTVLMNRIKGLHQVESMSDLVVRLEDLGMEDTEICKNLGMEPEEYYKLKQQLGIAHAFKNAEYSKSWEAK